MTVIQRPPGPEGGLYGVNNLINFQRDTLGFLTGIGQTYGDIAYFRMAAFHFYLINHPDYVYEALIRQGEKIEKWGRQTNTWVEAVGASTLTMEGEVWKRHRRLLNPSFHTQTIKRYLDIIIDHTNRLIESWQTGQTYEMMFEMMRTTMGIIADIIFSVKDIQRDAAELNRALTTVFEVLTARTTAFQQVPLWVPTRDNVRVKQASRTIEGFIMNLIRQRRAEGKDYGDVLSDLIAAKDPETGETLSDQEICNELKTLFGAGHETTALMLMWTLYLLAQNPTAAEHLHQEALEVIGEHGPALADIQSMPYTEMVLNELMRLYPPAWSLMVRKAKADLQFGKTIVPAGSVMLIPMWVVQRNDQIFPDPLSFNPERFAGDWKTRNSKYAFFPFGGGPHVCLGASLAMFEGQVILPMLIRRFGFELAPQPNIQLRALLTLRPAHGLYLKVVDA